MGDNVYLDPFISHQTPLFDKIYWGKDVGYYHGCMKGAGWIIKDKCNKCGKKMPNKKQLDTIRGLMKVVGDIDG